MDFQHILLQNISNEHEIELTFAKRLIYGQPTDTKSNWPSNDEILQQVVRAKEIFFNDLVYHFIMEEEVLFDEVRPLLKDLGEVRIIDMLLDQHIHLKKLFGELDTISTPKDILKLKLQDIGAILENHIHLEENQLFPILDSKIPKELLDKLSAGFKGNVKLKTKDLL
ncbi:MAG: hemerythrin domain-containing protein [Candidatus Hodarchaeales archaeon]|jgi:hemerythrin-like domain-containing protein